MFACKSLQIRITGELVTQPIGSALSVACIPNYMMLSVVATPLYSSSIHNSATSGLDLRSIRNLSEILLCLLAVCECCMECCMRVHVRAFRIHAFSLFYLQIMLTCSHKYDFIVF